MCIEDGPPLSLAGDLRRAIQLQGLPALPDLYVPVLLGVFRLCRGVDMDRGHE